MDYGVDVTGTKGASVHLRSICKALAGLGHSVRVITSRCSGSPYDAVPGVEVITLSMAKDFKKLRQSLRDVYGNQAAIPAETRQAVINREALSFLQADWEKNRPDLVLERLSLMGVAGQRVAKSMGITHLMEVNALLSEEARIHRGLNDVATARAVEDEVLRGSDHVFAVSGPLREAVMARGVKPENIEALPNGFDEGLFYPREAKSGGDLRIGMVGSMKSWHGAMTLLRAFAIFVKTHPDTTLRLIGEGPESEAIENFKEAHPKLKIETTGGVPHEEVPRLLGECDILTAPYEHQDNFYFSPMKVVECMALARPVIATSQGQICDLIKDGESGLLIEPGDVEALASALHCLADDEKLRAELGKNAAARTRQMTWSANAKRIVLVAEELRS